MVNIVRKNILFSVYLLGFLFSLQAALPNYINSSYLGTLMPEKYLGLIYIAEAILAIFGFVFMPNLLKKFGNFRIAFSLLLLEIISLLGLTLYHNIFAASVFMVTSIVGLTFLSFSFDIFLEGYSFDKSTGQTRGIYMTFVNLAWVFAPLLAGFILSDGAYWKIYLFALIIILPVFVILNTALSGFKDSQYVLSNPFKTFSELYKNKNLLNIFLACFFLQIFYSWMTIYTPIYLHTNLGLDWRSIGIIFGIMLLPFVFVQFPAGKLADSKLGEKEMLSVGFIIMSLATVAIYFTTGTNLLVWGLILFGTRVGAAVVEIMCDVYFFKKVDNQNANIISFYRMARPFAYIFGPLLATIILNISGLGLKNLFLVLGFLMIFGLKFSLSIKDTK
jgi:MFS family permease